MKVQTMAPLQTTKSVQEVRQVWMLPNLWIRPWGISDLDAFRRMMACQATGKLANTIDLGDKSKKPR